MLGYQVRHVGYCGMETYCEDHETMEEARQDAAKFIKRMRKKEFQVTNIDTNKWEVLEPDDCSMIPDQCGILWIRKIAGECNECGGDCDTNARLCENCHSDLYEVFDEE